MLLGRWTAARYEMLYKVLDLHGLFWTRTRQTSAIFWGLKPCSPSEVRFLKRPAFPAVHSQFSTLKMEAVPPKRR
jgi:hypothetical protein